MYQGFSIVGVEPNFANNEILVEASANIDSESVNDSTVELFSKHDGAYVNLSYKTNGKIMTIKVENEIILNSEYILRITKIKNVLGQELSVGIRRKVVFFTEIKEIPTVVSPCNYELIDELNVTLCIDNESSITSLKDKSYFIQIASDVAFNSIELESNISEDKTTLKTLKAGQYFIRARVTNGKQSGTWSNSETFIMKDKPKENDDNSSNCNCPDMTPEYIQYVSLTDYPENGHTPKDIILEFDGDLDPFSLDNIVIIRRDI